MKQFADVQDRESPRTRILVVDDDVDQLATIGDLLRSAGFDAQLLQTGWELREALARNTYALVLLDLHLSGETGLSIARELRATSTMPIIMISGAADEVDRILLLELAADDFLTKPFSPRELLARVRAVLRRSRMPAPNDPAPRGLPASPAATPPGLNMPAPTLAAALPPARTLPAAAGQVFHFGSWQLRVNERELIGETGCRCDLTAQEFRLLEVLVRKPNRVWTREQLIEQTRSLAADVYDRTIDVLILRLRRKIEPNPKLPQYICTERGLGYVFSAKVRTDE